MGPWLAVQKNAPLLLTNPEGGNVESLVNAVIRNPVLKEVDSLILLGNPKDIPMVHRPNPLEGKDRFIEMEPMTPVGNEPYSFAVGRLFHKDPNVVLLMLARPRLWQRDSTDPQTLKALVVSNPGGGLPLLETFSRTTASELANVGYDTTGIFAHRGPGRHSPALTRADHLPLGRPLQHTGA